MAITKTPRLDQTRWSSGSDEVKREDFDSDAESLETNAALFKEGPLSARPAAGVNGLFYTVEGDTAANNGRQYYDNGVEWKAPSYTNNQLAESVAAGDTPLTVRGKASQTADLLKVQNSSQVGLFRVTSGGLATNQNTVYGPGYTLGGSSAAHSSTAHFVAATSSKPVVVVRGLANQTGNLIEFRTSGNALLTQFNSGGGAVFTGGVSAASYAASGAVTSDSITVASSATLINAHIQPKNSSDTALTLSAKTNQSENLFELYNGAGVRVSRMIQDGTFATNGRIIAGGSGNVGTQSYSNSTAIVTLKNANHATTPLLNLYSNELGQTGRMIQGFDSNGVMKYWFDSVGNASVSNNFDADSIAVGNGSNTSPTSLFNDITPKFEVVTGASTGSYRESVTIRHPGKSSSAVQRRVGIQLKLSDESNQIESNKWSGIYAHSSLANAAQPNLLFYTNGTEAGRFEADNTFITNGAVQIPGSKALVFTPSNSNQIYLNGSSNSAGTIGMQTANTAFVRADQFAIYSGGSYSSDGLSSGGGTTMASFTTDRTLLKKLTITSPTAYDSTAPMLQLGNTTHMQFSAHSINSYDDANNNTPAEVNISNNGGRVRLGNTSSVVSVPSRIVWVGNIDDAGAANAILFARSSANTFAGWVGRPPQNGDWWFDHTTNRAAVHTGTEWKIFVPDHSASSIDG
jgi:hypothetical protein